MNPLIETYRDVLITYTSDIITSDHFAHFRFPLEPATTLQARVRTEMRPGSPGEARKITAPSHAEVIAEAKRQIDAFLDQPQIAPTIAISR